MPTPLNWTELIPFYIARTLPPEQMQRFEAQLAQDRQLQREVTEWRRIASAVWQEADSVARQVPPLAPQTLQKLTPRNAVRVPPYAAPLSEASAPPVPRSVRHARETPTFTLTLVAGLLLAFLCGGFLVLLAVNLNQNRIELIANLGTPSGIGGGGGDFGSSGATATRTLTAAELVGLTQTAIFRLTPLATPNPNLATPTPILMMTATPQTPLLPPPTATPLPTQAMLVADVCTITNATVSNILIYTAADRAAGGMGEMPAQTSLVPFQRTLDGWFGILVEGVGMGWVNGADVVITGNCEVLPLPTALPPATPTYTMQNLEMPPEPQIAVVTAPFADLRAAPAPIYEVLATVGQGYRLNVVGYEVGSGWLLVDYPDGRQMWVNSLSVTIEAALITPTPLP